MVLKRLLVLSFIILGVFEGFAQTLKKKKLDINSISELEKGFSIAEKTSLYISFELKNSSPNDTSIILEVGREELISLYEFKQNKLNLVTQTGIRVPIPERSVKNDLNILEIKLKGYEKRNFCLIVNNYFTQARIIKLKFWSTEGYQIHHAKHSETFYHKYWIPFFFTVLALALLLALVQYFILPERVFIYYFIYVILTLIRSASAIEIIRLEEWIPFLYKMGYRSMQSQIFTYLSFVFYILFIREFTNFPLKKPKLDVIFKGALVYLCFFVLFDAFFTTTKYTTPYLNDIFRSLEVIGLLLALISTILLLKVYDSLNKYIIFGAFSLLAIALLGQEILKRGIDKNSEAEFHSNALSVVWGIAYIIEIAFFIIALIFRQRDLLKNIKVQQEERELLEQNISLKEKDADFQTFTLATNQGVLVFNQSDIIRLEASGNYTIFVLHNQKQTLASYTIAEYETQLDPSRFVRVHRSHIVNIQYILKYIKGDGGKLTLQNGSEVPVSRSRKEDLLKKLDHLK